MSEIIAIDPGPKESAWIILKNGIPEQWRKEENTRVLSMLQSIRNYSELIGRILVIEKIASMGMAVGEEVFDTVFWAGRFYQAYLPGRIEMIPRMDVKMCLCNNSRAKDKNIRQALIDKFGGINSIKRGGHLHKVSGDVWAALGVAITAQSIIKGI